MTETVLQSNTMEKELSTKLLKKWEEIEGEINHDFEKTRSKVKRFVEDCKREGHKPEFIGAWLRPRLREYYSAQGVTKILPQECHRTYVQSGDYVGVAQARKLLQSSNLSTSSTPTTMASTVTTTKKKENMGRLRTEAVTTHETGRAGRFNQGPDEYEITKLKDYDADYLRDVVAWLHESKDKLIQGAFKWQRMLDELKAKVITLEEENARLRRELSK